MEVRGLHSTSCVTNFPCKCDIVSSIRLAISVTVFNRRNDGEEAIEFVVGEKDELSELGLHVVHCTHLGKTLL